MQDDMEFMREAIRLAREGMERNDGGPFGCVIVRNGEVVGRGWNRVTSSNDPTAHAEVVAIRDACATMNTFQLAGCDLYTSCEPCPMCMGAIYWARPDRVFFASTRHDAAQIGFDDSMIYEELALDLDKRRIPILNIGREEANSTFHAWMEKQDKVRY